MIGNILSVNGSIVHESKGMVSVDNLEFSYGFGVYEALKVRDGFLYFPELHIQRLFDSAKEIGLKHNLSAEIVKQRILELIDELKETSFNVKMLLIGKKDEGDLYIFATNPMFVPKTAHRDGIPVVTFEGERQFPNAKTLNMLVSYLGYRKAKDAGAYDGLFVDRDGFVWEGTRTNLFFTDGKTIFTPPVEGVLEGVTRKTVIEALGKKGIKVVEKKLKKSELGKYAGFFLTSTSSKILPISKIDDNSFEIPEIVHTARKAYDDYLDDYKKSLS